MRTTLAALLLLAPRAMAQEAFVPHHIENFALSSGVHDGLRGPGATTVIAFRQVIRVPNAPWLQLRFAEHQLGRKSFLRITSLSDGHTQPLTANNLIQWNRASAYFNGDALEVALEVAPGDERIFFRVEEIVVGEWVGSAQPDDLCGDDTRVASTDPAVGRIVPVLATGWIVANGAHLTAGHANDGRMRTLEFNVPPSLPSGTIVHPPPEDQYAIDAASIRSVNGDVGNDWAVFNVNPNANTGQLPVQRQNAFYRMSDDDAPGPLRVTGYGGAPGIRNLTEQTATGPNQGETVGSACRANYDYRVDTQGGNSGSPIIGEDLGTTFAIHTHGFCAISGYNSGTSFKNVCLQSAVNEFAGADARYVDASHPTTADRDGTAFRPFTTVSEGATSVPSGGIVSIVAGTYNENLLVDRPMTVSAPVGAVTIRGQ